MAEMRRNQKGEIRRQHVKAHYTYWQPCTDLCIFAYSMEIFVVKTERGEVTSTVKTRE